MSLFLVGGGRGGRGGGGGFRGGRGGGGGRGGFNRDRDFGPPDRVEGKVIDFFCQENSYQPYSAQKNQIFTYYISHTLPCVLFLPIEVGEVSHPCQDELVLKCTHSRVPYFNAPVYLENKQQVGKIDEILGPITDYVSLHTMYSSWFYIV